MSTYASQTGVDAAHSRAEIERTLARYGATSFAYATEDRPEGARAAVSFIAHDRQIRFILALPSRTERRFTHTPERGTARTAAAAEKEWEQACRQRWRALALLVKAQLEAVESGIVTFEDAFLPHTVIPGTRATVAEQIGPDLADAIATGIQPRLLIEGGPR